MPTATEYINQIQFIDGIISSKTEGLTHADSMLQLPFPANCMNWILGHLLVYRVRILGFIDGASQPDAAEFSLYGNGSQPLTDSAMAIPLETLLARLDVASAEIIVALENMPPERLSALADEQGRTVDNRLAFYVMFHESYHAGQLEPLRELALAQ